MIHIVYYMCTQTLFGESLVKVLTLTKLGWSCGHFVFPRFILYFFSHLWWFGFLGLGFYVDGVLGLWCKAIWGFVVRALYINI